tara:strand:- start:866 stop:1498 length:633 start_codon:yes stop_codon:yes gene_type:complete
MNLQKYKTIFWDFDGVIINSDEVRTEGFRFIFSNFTPKQINNIVEYHLNNGGLSRYDKIDYFFDVILKTEVSLKYKEQFITKYSDFCFRRLCNKNLLISNSLKFILKNFNLFNFHIVSASDQVELKRIAKDLSIEKYFKTIVGSPTTKIKNIEKLISTYQYNKEECCLIGDSKNDKIAAENNRIDFYGYNNHNLKSKSNYIDDFKKINSK